MQNPSQYEAAVRYHRAGRLLEAERGYLETLAERPDHDQSWFLLSLISLGRGDRVAAMQQLSSAIQHNPGNPAYYSNLGLVQRQLGQLDAAAQSLLHAVSLKPESAEANHNLGLVLRDLGEFPAALMCFERAADLSPSNAANQLELARILVRLSTGRRAVGHYYCALSLENKSAAVRRELGQLLAQLGRRDAAERLFAGDEPLPSGKAQEPIGAELQELLRCGCELREAADLEQAKALLLGVVEAHPTSLIAVLELAETLQSLGDLDGALMCLEQATDLEPLNSMLQLRLGELLILRDESELAIGHLQCAMLLDDKATGPLETLASLYQAIERPVAAEFWYQRALQRSPDSARLLAELASLLASRGNYDEAASLAERSLRIDPELASAWAAQALVHFDTGRVRDAIQESEKALALLDSPEIHARHLYMQMFVPGVSSAQIAQEAKRFDQVHARHLLESNPKFDNFVDPFRRLRVGFVSPDFRNHCQSFFTLPLFGAHDRAQYEFIGYSTTRTPDAITDQLRSVADGWFDVAALGDIALARQIRDDQVDILIDLCMHMHGGRSLMFARKPAPIQIAWLAYPGTTGLSAMDYRLTDPHLEPTELDRGECAERPLTLPDSFWCYDPMCTDLDISPLPALERGYVTFGSLNSFSKTNPDCFATWAGVMRAVDGSRLLLLVPPGESRTRTLREFEQLGIAPCRIEFVDRQPRRKYLELYHRIDIGLDTTPYNGHTTSLDALWMGVPVVSLVGKTAVSRAGLCLAQNIGLPELAATSVEQFTEVSLRYCQDLACLAKLRASLRLQLEASALMGATRFARKFEAALRQAWRDYCLKQ